MLYTRIIPSVASFVSLEDDDDEPSRTLAGSGEGEVGKYAPDRDAKLIRACARQK